MKIFNFRQIFKMLEKYSKTLLIYENMPPKVENIINVFFVGSSQHIRMMLDFMNVNSFSISTLNFAGWVNFSKAVNSVNGIES